MIKIGLEKISILIRMRFANMMRIFNTAKINFKCFTSFRMKYLIYHKLMIDSLALEFFNLN